MKPENYPEQPSHLWEHFYRISQIPRPSRQEQAVRQYVIDLAEREGCAWRQDQEGNLVVLVPGRGAAAERDTVIIQNHLDMVTVKSREVEHDFERDPLSLQLVDGWLMADGTTLGADNGVGCDAALALLTDHSLSHPPLELLFTVDEETGLGGALNLDAGLLSGPRMLNLDTEDWHELYVGCAGGGGWEFTRQFQTAAIPDDFKQLSLSVRGLAGGHSGIQIHEQLGNAVKLLGQCLQEVGDLRLGAIDIGVAHNVIPREGRVEFACSPELAGVLEDSLPGLREQWLSYLPAADTGVELSLQPGRLESALGADDSATLLQLVAAFPHGAQAYNLEQPADLVDVSINLAILRLEQGALFLEASYRFFNESQSLPLQQSVLALATVFGLGVKPVVGYPGWQPDFDSPLLALASDLHEQLFSFRPAVKAIHAGLECGILKSKKPDTDILSFGPTIRGAHSPSERLEVATVGPFWQFLTALLERM